MNHTIDENRDRIILTVNTHKYADSVAVSMKAFALGDKLNHHAKVITQYNKVEIELSTHDAGNKVTKLDHEFLKLMLDGI